MKTQFKLITKEEETINFQNSKLKPQSFDSPVPTRKFKSYVLNAPIISVYTKMKYQVLMKIIPKTQFEKFIRNPVNVDDLFLTSTPEPKIDLKTKKHSFVSGFLTPTKKRISKRSSRLQKNCFGSRQNPLFLLDSENIISIKNDYHQLDFIDSKIPKMNPMFNLPFYSTRLDQLNSQIRLGLESGLIENNKYLYSYTGKVNENNQGQQINYETSIEMNFKPLTFPKPSEKNNKNILNSFGQFFKFKNFTDAALFKGFRSENLLPLIKAKESESELERKL